MMPRGDRLHISLFSSIKSCWIHLLRLSLAKTQSFLCTTDVRALNVSLLTLSTGPMGRKSDMMVETDALQITGRKTTESLCTKPANGCWVRGICAVMWRQYGGSTAKFLFHNVSRTSDVKQREEIALSQTGREENGCVCVCLRLRFTVLSPEGFPPPPRPRPTVSLCFWTRLTETPPSLLCSGEEYFIQLCRKGRKGKKITLSMSQDVYFAFFCKPQRHFLAVKHVGNSEIPSTHNTTGWYIYSSWKWWKCLFC